ncbi:heparinase II/III family protein [Rhodopila sp.]|uniref:heparinase II/III family protein n=1 Tax=Rhodopila sp. TaxID=2480087 RepID=UPI003D0DB26E
MSPASSGKWLRGARRTMARLPSLRMGRVPDAPALSVRDPWPGDGDRGAKLIKGELEINGAIQVLRLGGWAAVDGSPDLRAGTHGFTWLRDLRALGTDAARLRARGLVSDWINNSPSDSIAHRPDVLGARITAWLAHYDFFAATADDAFRQRLMARLVSDARSLSAALPAEELDARALTALKGLVAAAVALREHTGFLARALRFLPQEITRQILPDGCHAERSPAAQLSALQDLTEIRALLQTSQTSPPPALANAIDRMAPALRLMRHGDGGLALFNGSKEESDALVNLVLNQAGRGGRSPPALNEGGFHRMQAGRSVLIVDCGAPPPPGVDRHAHAGTLSMELSVGRDRLIVNCGAFPAGSPQWRDASRATAAHSTMVLGDINSSELRPEGLGRRPVVVEAQRQEGAGAHWLDASHDGWRKPFNAIYRRRLYMAESGEDVRGEDLIESPDPQPFTLRFHLHPHVQASLQQDGATALLRLRSGSFWRLRADGARLTLEESIYLGGTEPRRSEQIVLTGFADGPQMVKWALSKVERAG